MSNTEQIVRQIIDILSDGVSELVLLVVVLREQNANMPPHLPTASGAVNETAKKLGLIARKLASTDYKDFAEIGTEINAAADSLDQATAVLGRAVSILSGGGERKKGWDDLVDACRVLSGKTIRLLHIVYGAPLKRLKINADRLHDQMTKFDAHPKSLQDPKAQQKLLDELKPITEKAMRMEKHLGDRAKAAESPQAKQQLQDAAADIHKKAQDLVDAVNKAFNEPGTPDLQKPLDALRDAVEAGRDLSETTAPPAPKNLPEPIPKGPQAVPQGPKNFHDHLDQAKNLAKAIPDIASKEPINLPDAQDRLKDEVEQIRKKAQLNPEQWKDVEQPLNDQTKAARDLARKPKNPVAKKVLDDATDNLVKALEDVGAKHGGSSPRGQAPGKKTVDPQTKKKMVDQIKDIAPDLTKAINTPEKKQELDQAKLKDNLQSLRADVKQHKPKQAEQHAKQAAQAAQDLANDLHEKAKNPNFPPEVRKAHEDAAQELEKAIPEFVAAARDANKDLDADAPVRDLHDKMNKLERAAQRAVPKPAPHAKVAREDWNQAKDDMQ